MAAGEHHPKLAVLDLRVEKHRVEPLVVGWTREGPSSQNAITDPFASQRIADLVLGDAVHPARWIVRHTADPPRLQGIHERGLHHVLDKLEFLPAEETGKHSDQTPRLVAKKVLHERSDRLLLWPGHRYQCSRIRENSRQNGTLTSSATPGPLELGCQPGERPDFDLAA